MKNTPHESLSASAETPFIHDDYKAAARRCLTPEAAERYCAGDMTATDEVGHEAIAREASVVCAERLERAPTEPAPREARMTIARAHAILARRCTKPFAIIVHVWEYQDGRAPTAVWRVWCDKRQHGFEASTLDEAVEKFLAEETPRTIAGLDAASKAAEAMPVASGGEAAFACAVSESKTEGS
jgi:alcohol dehydrogenase class IV